MMILQPPRFRRVSGRWTVSDLSSGLSSAYLVLRRHHAVLLCSGCCRSSVAKLAMPSVRSRMEMALDRDVDALDQKRDDAGLLGRARESPSRRSSIAAKAPEYPAGCRLS